MSGEMPLTEHLRKPTKPKGWRGGNASVFHSGDTGSSPVWGLRHITSDSRPSSAHICPDAARISTCADAGHQQYSCWRQLRPEVRSEVCCCRTVYTVCCAACSRCTNHVTRVRVPSPRLHLVTETTDRTSSPSFITIRYINTETWRQCELVRWKQR
jgi:hypothetical protein